ncbi:ATP-binding cassette domain-containing protein [Sulfurospirillum sp. 1612]|uniref:ATP-binding cassette domain-containing protein n=1 Tax=Sulfurospirillum sp. 1612 TaxID=3094835 RepID=UPI002F94477F
MLKVENLFLKKGSFVLQKLSFEVETNSYFVILGKTGSGKTMLLEALAGIQSVEGSISFDGKEITNLPPERRNFGFVYQDFKLFPNMNVRENIVFSSRYKKIENEKELFQDLIDFLQIKKILDRKITNLSGGEKQRVAIARAIYSRPKLLLLDEPLSAVDPTFRNTIMKSLKDIVKRYQITIVHVTHNFREASYLADKIAIILDGKILQTGKTDEVLNKPTSIEVAKFLGFKNIFPSTFLGFDQENRFFSIDPNKIKISSQRVDQCYNFPCTIETIMGISDHYKIFAKSGEMLFFVKIPQIIFENFDLQEGHDYFLNINKKDIAFI